MHKKLGMILTLLLCMGMVFSTPVYARSDTETKEEEKTDKEEKGKKVYFASPMFNSGEKDFNLEVVKVLEKHGYEVFLPQRDGIEGALLEGKTEEEMIKMIFELDDKEVQKADIVFMNLDGRVPDEGACVELGMAYARGKRCYGIKTDTRSLEKNMDLNPMISGCMIKIFQNYDGDEVLKELDQYLSENEL
ncbi:MAG: nucleoside 2-deoxyribosyltransferase domain-containing protein [Faecalicoccus sp.]|nr:nucleoside 2-deoxyribosyltransferase domain-containing protein [Faecalicoccus sp.]